MPNIVEKYSVKNDVVFNVISNNMNELLTQKHEENSHVAGLLKVNNLRVHVAKEQQNHSNNMNELLTQKHENKPHLAMSLEVNNSRMYVAKEQRKHAMQNNSAYCLNKRDAANIVASVIFCEARLHEYLISDYWTSLANRKLLSVASNSNNVCCMDYNNANVQQVAEDKLIPFYYSEVQLQSAKNENAFVTYDNETIEDIVQKQVAVIVDELLQKDKIDITKQDKDKLVKNISAIATKDSLHTQSTTTTFADIVPHNSSITVDFVRNIFVALSDYVKTQQQYSLGFFPGQRTSEFSEIAKKFRCVY